jgi:hypothetical protein
VGSGQIVAFPPFFDHPLCFLKVTEPMLVQTFIPKLAVKAFDVGILHRSAGIDEVVFHSLFLSPAKHGLAGKLWSIIQYQQPPADHSLLFGLPAVVGVVGNAVLPAQIPHLNPSLGLLQNPDDLPLAEPAAFHGESPNSLIYRRTLTSTGIVSGGKITLHRRLNST